MKGKISAAAISALMLISLISVFQAGTASAQVPPPTNINIVVDNDWENDEQVKADVGENFTWGENAFAKIQDAIDNARPNDNILVYPGTYNEDVTVDVENLTLIGVGGPVLDASGCEFGFSVQAAGVTIDSFAVINAGKRSIEVYGENIEGGSVTIRNNSISNGKEGIYFLPSIVNSEVEVTGNTIDNNSGADITWRAIRDSHVLMENNSISNSGWGIYFYEIENSVVGIIGNAINNNGDQGIQFYSSIVNSVVGIAGNTIDNNGLKGIYFRSDISSNSTVLIENNSISNNGGEGLLFGVDIVNSEVGITGNTIDNNDTGIYIGVGVDATGVAVNYNNIVNNIAYGVNNLGTGTLDVTLNWWGTAVGIEIVTMVSENVEYYPWLNALYPGGQSVDYGPAIEALESDVDNLMDRVGALENGVGTLENELGTLSSRVDALENDPDNLTTQIGSLKVEVDNLQIKISGIEFSISELDSRISKLDENMSDLLIRISEFKSDVENHETRILSLESEATNLDARVEWLEMTVRLHETRILSLENQVNTLMDMVAELRAMVDGQASEIAGLQGDLASFIAGTQLWVSSIENRLSELGVTDNTLWGTIENVKSDLEGIELTPGPQGPKGSTGDTGPQGPQGSPGSQRPSGITPAEIEELESKIEELEKRLSELESSPGTLSAPAGEGLEPCPWALVLGATATIVLIGVMATFYRLRGKPREMQRK